MSLARFLGVAVTAGFLFSAPASAEVFSVILRGKVVMNDGSPPPKSVGIQRICSDGPKPGPLTNNKGEFIWTMEVDPMRSRVCRLEATFVGHRSSSIDISSLDGSTTRNIDLPTITLTPSGGDPYTISTSQNNVPSKAAGEWKAAVQAIQKGDIASAREHTDAAVKAAPKFAQGLHALGVLNDQLAMFAEARTAFEQAIEADPKQLAPYIALQRTCVKLKDWACAAKTGDSLIKADSKKSWTEVHIHQAVAKYWLKDLAGAEASAREAVRVKSIRAEYVLGRILEAKGDLNAAKEHMNAYLAQDSAAPDAELIKKHMEFIGKPEAASVDPELENI